MPMLVDRCGAELRKEKLLDPEAGASVQTRWRWAGRLIEKSGRHESGICMNWSELGSQDHRLCRHD